MSGKDDFANIPIKDLYFHSYRCAIISEKHDANAIELNVR